jgi:hypothetical protein
VLGTLDGGHRHPERFSRQFVAHIVQVRKALGEELLPVIRLHDLRHAHATLLLAAGEPVKVVSERLGHANATITPSPSISTCTLAWGGRQPTASQRCSTADADTALMPRSITAVSRGPFGPPNESTSSSGPAGTPR